MSVDYDLTFDDRTLLETEGDFEEVIQIMKEDSPSDTWMLRSGMNMIITIHGQMLEAQFLLHFYSDGQVYIVEYRPSSADMAFNPDISGLSAWIKSKGWRSLAPHSDLVRQNLEFWKFFWETHLVDSEYLDNNYGKRS